jgi:hypothetical protein
VSDAERPREDIHASIYGLRREPGETDQDLARRIDAFVEARCEEWEWE